MVTDNFWALQVTNHAGVVVPHTVALDAVLAEYPLDGTRRRSVTDPDMHRFAPTRSFTSFPFIRDEIKFSIVNDEGGLRAESRYFSNSSELTIHKARAVIENITSLKWSLNDKKILTLTEKDIGSSTQAALVNELAKFGAYAIRGKNALIQTLESGVPILGNGIERIDPTIPRQSVAELIRNSGDAPSR